MTETNPQATPDVAPISTTPDPAPVPDPEVADLRDRVAVLEAALADTVVGLEPVVAAASGPSGFCAYDLTYLRFADGGPYATKALARSAAKDQGFSDFDIREV